MKKLTLLGALVACFMSAAFAASFTGSEDMGSSDKVLGEKYPNSMYFNSELTASSVTVSWDNADEGTVRLVYEDCSTTVRTLDSRIMDFMTNHSKQILLVDPQEAFTNGGSLGSIYADEDYTENFVFEVYVLRQLYGIETLSSADSHLESNSAFARNQGVDPFTRMDIEFANVDGTATKELHTAWPDHCIIDPATGTSSHGTKLFFPQEMIDLVIPKGDGEAIVFTNEEGNSRIIGGPDSYGVIKDQGGRSTGAEFVLKENLLMGGLVTPICVNDCVNQVFDLGRRPLVIQSWCRGLQGFESAEGPTYEAMKGKDIVVIPSIWAVHTTTTLEAGLQGLAVSDNALSTEAPEDV